MNPVTTLIFIVVFSLPISAFGQASETADAPVDDSLNVWIGFHFGAGAVGESSGFGGVIDVSIPISQNAAVMGGFVDISGEEGGHSTTSGRVTGMELLIAVFETTGWFLIQGGAGLALVYADHHSKSINIGPGPAFYETNEEGFRFGIPISLRIAFGIIPNIGVVLGLSGILSDDRSSMAMLHLGFMFGS
ncbi:MAG: hypothetical protein CMJ46_03990 [Planctomyces sp.]|nr:hypothetical protein [Planctomyces sp.]